MKAVSEIISRQAANETMHDTVPDCCSAFYEQDWVRLLAQDLFHPGGRELTDRTVDSMALAPSQSLLDLGCGTGTSAIAIAERLGVRVTGVDLSEANVKRARERAVGVHPPIRFEVADVHSLPAEDNQFDAALAECTFSLFADQTLALREVRRVLKPGGQLGVTDMATGVALAPELREVLAPWTCLADAVDEQSYIELFEKSGFAVQQVADESQGLTDLVVSLKRKLLMIAAGSMLAPTGLPEFDLGTVRHWLDVFRREVDRGAIRYLRFQLMT
jgi:ubiquinone/menaquinone biosynthesis C-methylase UbiE